ncbi:hypothetical protein A9264_03305 [Vibrio sp. UCD-FRSSP16_10]|uniref:hypothetical protein n=1 Tax=unclassified Vibrio TaxID=2614977 RepID=UPI0007FF09F8|nr:MULTISPECIES: hypothetical protein [unclassified Vibrio]OBT12177.1 hypothetical protein A9260_04755 [Vibrio sp. UCD-FRSSP16_30]OBT20508.1 hypothetical protein A9264_03305 [Vibrio sp. UCD-FRSSP16_10]
MSDPIEKNFNLGGSIDKALAGDFELKPVSVITEAWQLTMRNFLSFSPAVILLIAIQVIIFIVALKFQIGDISEILTMFQSPETLDPAIFQSIFVANFSFEVVAAPIYAGVALMAMSHAAGLSTQTGHITKGLQFMLPVILVTMINLLSQAIAGALFPLLSLYLSLAFSNAMLLVCEKRLTPVKALWISLRAVNKRIFSIAVIYLVTMMAFLAGMMMYGLGLVVAVPFFFHAKGIIYRNMFGIRLQVVASSESQNANTETEQDNHSNDDNSGPKSGSAGGSNTFDA